MSLKARVLLQKSENPLVSCWTAASRIPDKAKDNETLHEFVSKLGLSVLEWQLRDPFNT